jgi:hypothetical protein
MSFASDPLFAKKESLSQNDIWAGIRNHLKRLLALKLPTQISAFKRYILASMSLREVIQIQSGSSEDPVFVNPVSGIAGKLVLPKTCPDVDRPRRIGEIIRINLVDLETD